VSFGLFDLKTTKTQQGYIHQLDGLYENNMGGRERGGITWHSICDNNNEDAMIVSSNQQVADVIG
jgi:hypothetical protein